MHLVRRLPYFTTNGAAVSATGSLRDQAIVIVMLHTGLRAAEICTLRRDSVTLGKRSGVLRVVGKRNKYRDVPLNATARAALTAYMGGLDPDTPYLFPSGKTGQALSERALGHLIRKYAMQARLADVSPHDLRHRFGYRMAAVVPLHRLAQLMGTTRSIPRCCMYAEHHRICKPTLSRSHGNRASSPGPFPLAETARASRRSTGVCTPGPSRLSTWTEIMS